MLRKDKVGSTELPEKYQTASDRELIYFRQLIQTVRQAKGQCDIMFVYRQIRGVIMLQIKIFFFKFYSIKTMIQANKVKSAAWFLLLKGNALVLVVHSTHAWYINI